MTELLDLTFNVDLSQEVESSTEVFIVGYLTKECPATKPLAPELTTLELPSTKSHDPAFRATNLRSNKLRVLLQRCIYKSSVLHRSSRAGICYDERLHNENAISPSSTIPNSCKPN